MSDETTTKPAAEPGAKPAAKPKAGPSGPSGPSGPTVQVELKAGQPEPMARAIVEQLAASGHQACIEALHAG